MGSKITEVLNKSDPVEKWIKDFIKSDAPQFKGKSKKERIKMAIAAHRSAQNESVMNEDTEKQKKYQAFFQKALKKFGVNSPNDFTDPKKKKEFFDYVDKNWKGENESFRVDARRKSFREKLRRLGYFKKTAEEKEQTSEESEKQKKYQEFFQKALKKFGVGSPAELEGEKKKEFFDYIDKNWKGEKEEAYDDEKELEEASRFEKMLKAAGNRGPWTVVAINPRNKVIDQQDVKDPDLIPAVFNVMKKDNPSSKVSIEVSGKIVYTESLDLEEEVAGWIAFFNGKKLEIRKGKDAKDMFSAKQFAIKALKVPKSKQGLLAIKPAFDESLDLEEESKTDMMKRINKEIGKKGPWIVSIKVKGRTKEKSKVGSRGFVAPMVVGFKQRYPDGEVSVKVDGEEVFSESTELEEAADVPFKKLEQAWMRTGGDKKKQERLIKKHNLRPVFSANRPGEIKLGVINKLDSKKDITFAGLDDDDNLVFVTNNPMKIRYPKKGQHRPKGAESKVVTESMRFEKIVSLATGSDDIELIREFVEKAELPSDPSTTELKHAWKKFNINK